MQVSFSQTGEKPPPQNTATQIKTVAEVRANKTKERCVAGQVQVSKQPKCPNVPKESDKGDLVPLGRESQKIGGFQRGVFVKGNLNNWGCARTSCNN